MSPLNVSDSPMSVGRPIASLKQGANDNPRLSRLQAVLRIDQAIVAVLIAPVLQSSLGACGTAWVRSLYTV
jgi:hypothetical protein